MRAGAVRAGHIVLGYRHAVVHAAVRNAFVTQTPVLQHGSQISLLIQNCTGQLGVTLALDYVDFQSNAGAH